MSTRLFLNGRVLRIAEARDRFVQREPLPEPLIGYKTSDTIYKADDGLTFRVVDNAPIEDGWVDEGVLHRWFGIDHDVVVHAVKRGLLDLAMRRGSAIPLFRVRDTVAMTRLVESIEPKKVRRRER